MLKKSLMLLAVCCLLFSCAKEEIINPEPGVQNTLKTGDDEDEPGANHEIDGTVSDENGDGENGVTVQLDTADGLYVATRITNTDGHYHFADVCVGDYLVRVRPNHGNEEVYSVRIE